MKITVKRKIPKITLVTPDELNSMDLFVLNNLYKMDRSEFVLVEHGREEIYLNEEMPQLAPLIEEVMYAKYVNRVEKTFDEFRAIAGDKAEMALLRIWHYWRDERKEADLKEEAEKILKTARKECLRKYIRPNRENIKMLFDIGFGIYEKGAKCDYQTGAENAFLFGCLYAVNNGLTGKDGVQM